MKRICVTGLGILLLALAPTSHVRAADVNFINGGDFNSAANWDDGMLPGAIPTDDHFVQNGLTALYAGGTVSMGKLIVSDSSPGRLEMSSGDLTVGGGNESFAIGRSLNGDGVVELSGDAILRTAAGDSSFVGQRDKGLLHIGPSAAVLSPDAIWRVGQFGLIPNGLEGEGLVDVEGTLQARLIFLGVDGGEGLLRVRGNGSVTLSDNLVPNVNTLFPSRSAKVEMIGSNATLVAQNLESANGAAEVKNEYLFVADAGGVSPITLNDAVNIDNNKLTVDLTSFALSPGMSLTLFDAAPERVFGRFMEVMVTGVGNPADYSVIYEDQPGGSGDILLLNMVPEPAALWLTVLGTALTVGTRRRLVR